jgi:hypothetical protein
MKSLGGWFRRIRTLPEKQKDQRVKTILIFDRTLERFAAAHFLLPPGEKIDSPIVQRVVVSGSIRLYDCLFLQAREHDACCSVGIQTSGPPFAFVLLTTGVGSGKVPACLSWAGAFSV